MRKCVVILLLGLYCFPANTQSVLPTRANQIHLPVPISPDSPSNHFQNNPKPLPFNPNAKSAVTCDDGSAEVGSSYDIFSNFLVYQNQVIYNPELNALAFVHTQNDDEPGGAGFISYEYSLDGGENWVLGHKPITPTLDLLGDGSIFGTGNRYPNGTIYNPPGNTDPANAYFVSVGTAFWPNPNNTILGYEYVASSPLIFDGNDVSERYYTDPNHTFYRPSSFASKTDGTLWYVNTSWDYLLDPSATGPNSFKDFFVTKLTFNSATKSFDKEIVDTLEMNYNGVPPSAFRGQYNIGFSPNGQYGYVCFLGGDADQPQVQASPVIWFSTDGGNTWTKDATLDYNQMTELLKNTLTLTGLVDINDLVNKRPFMSEYDMTVDNNGDLHLFADMYGGSSFHPDSLNYGYFNGVDAAKLFHFIYFQNSNTWFSSLVKPWRNIPGFIGNTPLRPHPQAGRTPDGKRIFFAWSESEPEGDVNYYSDTWGYGFDTESSTATLAKNLYSDAGSDLQFFGKFPTLSPVTFPTGGGCDTYDFELPHVISIAFDGPFDPTPHYYLQGVGFNEAEFTEPVSFYPTADFSFTGLGFTTDFTDISLGTPTSWLWDFGDGNTSTDQNPSHTFASAGTYTVCLTVTNDFGSNGPKCQAVSVPYSPIADFSYTVNSLSVNFTDLSVGDPDTWEWDFGDGNTSTLQNPTHMYAANGDYTVCLISSNQGGSSPSVCKNISSGISAPVADFSFTVFSIVVNFTDLSVGNPDTWEWNFGDGNTSTLQNPVHVYNANGDYTVCLISSNQGGSSPSVCKNILVGMSPVADFSFVVNGLNVDFTDLSTGNPDAWEWDFGDGNTSTVQNPTHVYAAIGDYTVCFVASDLGFSSPSVCKNISVGIAPSADFNFTVLGLEVTLQDLSANSPTDWQWTFGDGNSSTQQNPVHVYGAIGSYEICLVASNTFGTSAAACKMVMVGGIPEPDFSFSVNLYEATFTDLSSNIPSDWAWDFGDGNQSNEQNPVHVYASNGTYNVCLTASNTIGQSMASCKNVTIAVSPLALFSAEVTDFTVALTDLSENQPTAWAWDFGDGNQSTIQNPTHSYAAIGDYNVCLTVSNSAGMDSACALVQIVVGSALEELGFGKLLVFPNPFVDQTFITTTEHKLPADAQVEIVDAQGRLVATSNINASSTGFSIDASDWLPGLYFFSVKWQGTTLASGKLVKGQE
ncbi:MAG: PKD domain-containing protein [Saprospiraceae bacterium]